MREVKGNTALPMPSPSQRGSFVNALRPPPVPSSSRPPSTSSMSTKSMSDSESSSDPTSGFTSFDTLVDGVPRTETLTNTVYGLDALRTVLEAVNTLPFVKYLASVGIQVLTYVIETQITNDSFKNLAFRAKDIIIAVAQACDGMNSIAARLEQDLRQLTSTMNAILAFATEKTKRRTYQKLFAKAEDAQAVQSLDVQLTHAFQLFEIQSSVSTRTMQHEMSQQLSTMSFTTASSRSEFIPDVPLRVPEGIYLIKSATNGWVLETDEHKREGGGVHVYLASSQDGRAQTQLWSVQKSPIQLQGSTYTIMSVATGLVLNVFLNTNRNGSKVVCHGFEGAGNDSWSFWATRQGMSGDFCTIRSAGLTTVIDGVCPRGDATCYGLHANHIAPSGPTVSQEWNLLSLTSVQSGSVQQSPAISLPRRPLLLQNVLTGTLATRAENTTGPNVSLTQSVLPASTWTIIYSGIKDSLQMDCFCLATSSTTPLTLDHYGGSHINVSKFWPGVVNHQWAPSARDGVFIFRNVGSGALLASSRSHPGLVDTMPASALDDPACHWRLLDALTKEHIRVLYDSALSVMPPELVGRTSSVPPVPPHPLVMYTGIATSEMRLAMLKSFEQEHETIRDLLQEGYKALIVAPRLITGWRDGRVKKVAVWDDKSEFSEHGRINFEPCM